MGASTSAAGAGPEPTTTSTVAPFATTRPEPGVCVRTAPFFCTVEYVYVTRPTLQPAAVIACFAAASLRPASFGTLHVSGGGEAVILNVRATDDAALKFAFPPCEAVIVHDPTAVGCTDVPPTVHGPLAA